MATIMDLPFSPQEKTPAPMVKLPESRPTPKTLMPFRLLKDNGRLVGLEYDEKIELPYGQGVRTIPKRVWNEKVISLKPILELMEMYAELERSVDGLLAECQQHTEEKVALAKENERLCGQVRFLERKVQDQEDRLKKTGKRNESKNSSGSPETV